MSYESEIMAGYVAEISTLRAEVERLTAALDEARASLAAAEEALRHEDKARSDAQAEVNRLTASLARARLGLDSCVDDDGTPFASARTWRAECARLRVEGRRADPLEKALRDAADALWAAWQMLSAVNASEPSRDRHNAAMAASRAASAARHALDVANPVRSTWYGDPERCSAPRSSAEDAAPRCSNCTVCGGTGELQVGLVKTEPCHYCYGTGHSPSTGGGA